MYNCVIVIPIYKSTPEWYEEISFNQVVKVLFKHEFVIVTFEELDISYYADILKENNINFGVRYFDKIFFESVVGYNQLMLSKQFYQTFINYEFILIYQLDAYVFRDELDYWCEQNYDFIGAPLPELTDLDYRVNKTREPVMVGNGGFSLRKTKSILDFLSHKKPVIKPKRIFEHYKKAPFKIRYVFSSIAKCLGYKNRINYFVKSGVNEDKLFCLLLDETWIKRHLKENDSYLFLKIPSVATALRFSFELYPEEMLVYNNNELPFGCHAWNKYEYETFWKKIIN